MYLKNIDFSFVFLLAFLVSCNKNADLPVDKTPPSPIILKISFSFDSLQERLNDEGNVSNVPFGFGALSPEINKISIGYIELLSDSTTEYGYGNYIAIGDGAISGVDTGFKCCWDAFDETFNISTQLQHSLVPDTFKWIRIYFNYQNYTIRAKINGVVYEESISAFLAQKAFTYHFEIKDSTYDDFSLKTNGEWFMEVDTPGYGVILHDTAITTSPNVLYNSNPTPFGSCILTCRIDPPLFINDPDSLSILISISTNKSFVWVEHSDPAFFEPFNGDTVYDVGIRGVKVLH